MFNIYYNPFKYYSYRLGSAQLSQTASQPMSQTNDSLLISHDISFTNMRELKTIVEINVIQKVKLLLLVYFFSFNA